MILYTRKKFDKRTLLALLSCKKGWFTSDSVPYLNADDMGILLKLIREGALQCNGKYLLVNRFNQEGATLYEWRENH